MKKYLLLIITSFLCLSTFAQDVIVKKDGSTILTKVQKVTQTEVEYKLYAKPKGQSYKIPISELTRINYENGQSKVFVETPVKQEIDNPSTNNIRIVTHEEATQFSDDQNLLAIYDKLHAKPEKAPKVVTPEMLYKKGKRFKTAGYVIGGTLVAAGVACIIAGATDAKYETEMLYASGNNITDYKYYNRGKYGAYDTGYVFIAAGAAVGIPLVLRGSALQKKTQAQVQASSAISQDINFGNGSSLNLGVDMLSDNLSYISKPGIGIRYNF